MPLRKLRRLLRTRKQRLTYGSSPRGALSVAISAMLGLAGAAHAGDILRGGATVGMKPTSAGTGVSNPAVQQRAGAAGRDALARTTQALKSLQSLQQAARDAAVRGGNNLGKNPNAPGQQLPNVANGLTLGGLKVAPGVPVNLAKPVTGEDPSLWKGAKLPKETTLANGDKEVTIQQTSQQAVLTWETFNVGKNTDVYFNQSTGTQKDGSNNWIAINKILDPSGSPSQILGSIHGEGSVYLINQNGILFGGSSQVNLHSFVASSLPINDNLLSRGLLNNPDAQFLFSALPITAGANGTPAFTPPDPLTPDKQVGDVTVMPGAQLSAPSNSSHVGGRVALIGANVTNAGTISTPDGQTILASGLQVGFSAHTSSDPSLRGLDVFVGAVQKGTDALYAGTSINSGLILSPRAAITITGRNVFQNGGIDSSTSVSLNGRIDLYASYNAAPYPNSTGGLQIEHPAFLFGDTGNVTLGADSITRILPEYDSTETVVGTQLALNSQVNLRGHVLHLDTGSTLLAPSAKVSMDAGVWRYVGGGVPISTFVYRGGQVYLENGASINVAGSTDISAPLTENILDVELRGSELADSPLQRNGLFRGLTIKVDVRQSGIYNGRVWIGTPLADASGYLGLVERTVGELTTAGGTVNLRAGDSVVMQSGSKIDVSGGWVNFESGLVQTTRVLSNGALLDISQATPDLAYSQIYTGTSTFSRPKYGVTETFTNPLAMTGAHLEPGYTFGAAGGSVSITAPSMALDGSLLGNTVTGPRQRSVLPAPSSLSIAFEAQQDLAPLYPNFSPTPPAIVFSDSTSARPADAFAVDANGEPLALRADRRASVTLSPELVSTFGFGNLTVENSDGEIMVPKAVKLTGQAGGSLKLNGSNVAILGDITLPGGSVTLHAHDISPKTLTDLDLHPDTAKTPDADPTRGLFTLGSDATISTAGLRVNDRPGAAAQNMLPLALDGGSIVIGAFSANLEAGSTLDVSGGYAISGTSKYTYGRGGSISIAAGQAAQVTDNPILAGVTGGHLDLHANLRGYSGVQGGALSILAPTIQIGGTTTNSDTLLLQPQFFQQGGFASYSLQGLGAKGDAPNDYVPAISVAPGTVIEPLSVAAIAAPGLGLQPYVAPEGARAPASISLAAVGVRDSYTKLPIFRGDLIFGEGAVISTDARASVSLTGETAVIAGSIIAPGGSINIAGGKDSNSIFPESGGSAPLTTVYLAPTANLSAAGKFVASIDPRTFRSGLPTGSVVGGGSISVSGNLVAATGSALDVSGASSTVTLPLGASATPAQLAALPMNGTFAGYAVAPMQVDSSAGSITLAGGQMLATDATLLARAGGPMGTGGTLNVSSGFFLPVGSSTLQTPLDVTLSVAQNGSRVGTATIGEQFTAPVNFGVNRYAAGGFDALTLKGTVRFESDVTITAPRELSVADNGVIFAKGDVMLSAPHVSVGTAFRAPFAPQDPRAPFTVGAVPFNFDPSYGTGTLTVVADLIDVGNLSLQNIGRTNFIANGGDIRGDGTLNVSGALNLRAAQIYPPTDTTFTIVASDYDVNSAPRAGSVTILASGTSPLPLSAGGELNVYASLITQGGTLRAPMGGINLGWDGTGDAPVNLISGHGVNETKLLKLTAGSVTSVSAVDPVTGQFTLIPYGLNLNGSSWIDPSGVDITAGGLPGKAITIAGNTIRNQPGATIDLRGGGGDLFSYRFVPGLGGSQDILASTTSFAIVPGYGESYMPFAPFTTATSATNLGGDPGYVNSSLHAGDQIYLAGMNGLAAGVYTLLPARYSVLPGAFLVTPNSTRPTGTLQLADGSSLVSGYRLNSAHDGAPSVNSTFQVAPLETVIGRAQYDLYTADDFLAQGAVKNGLAVPRLPIDAGHLILQATNAMTLRGDVLAQAPSLGRGGLVDISSPVDIVITGAKDNAPAGTLALNAADLSGFGAESLLIGGIRQLGSNGASVTVTTNSLTVANAGTPLSAPDVILVAKQNLTFESGASIIQSGSLSGGADPILLGQSSVAGSGNGVLVRVSADTNAQISRSGVTPGGAPSLTIGDGVQFAGGSLILDSTASTTLSPTAQLRTSVISLNSGQVSIQLENSTVTPPTTGLVLTGGALQTLQSAQSLSLLSYSTIDFYGSGTVSVDGSLALHAADIRGFGNNGGSVALGASRILIDNSANTAPSSDPAPTAAGTLTFRGDVITLGANATSIDGFSTVQLNATGGVLANGKGSLSTQDALQIQAPLITGTKAAEHSLVAGGALLLDATSGAAAITPGLGATLNFQGASVTANGDIALPSGSLTLRAVTGDLNVGGTLNVAGTTQQFFDLTRYTGAGEIKLTADAGSVTIGDGGTLNVSAPGVAKPGQVSISAKAGTFTATGALLAHGTGGGSFALDVAQVAESRLGPLNALLNDGGFSDTRSFRIRTGDILVDGTATAHNFRVSADVGSITLSGTVDASGLTGGSIELNAHGSTTLLSGSTLDVSAHQFDHAGKGGAVVLAAGSETNGVIDQTARLDLESGSSIKLDVAATAKLGDFSGTLHLRAPRTSNNQELNITAVDSTITGASSIIVEGYKLYTPAGGLLTTNVRDLIKTDGNTFAAKTDAINARIFANNAALLSVVSITPGAELINRSGDLVLGTATSTGTAQDWDLSTFRFGNAAGVLTLRAAGNLTFYNSLSDGFVSSAQFALLQTPKADVAANAQSWSYHLAAGADFSAADFRQVKSPDALAATSGNLNLGKDGGQNNSPSGEDAKTSQVVGNKFQVIRTGSGDIEIAAARDIKLLNPFASIYTAGTAVAAPKSVINANDFDLPVLILVGGSQGPLGGTQTLYAPQYAYAGGNVTLSAGADITRQTLIGGVLVADSSRQLPGNWLYRRGYVDPATGLFGSAAGASPSRPDIASTTWWVDYSNFFQGVGALGGGNVTLTAGRDVSNVDAVVPTNARMAGKDSTGKALAPNSANMVELGGGDLRVTAGRDIDGGIYYVERGQGTLSAANTIHTNATRSPSLGLINSEAPLAPETWLPTTLFLGKGSFDVTARGDLLLGPVANPFLLPGGFNNTFWLKTYFNTYAADSSVNLSSLGGNITLRTEATLTSDAAATPILLSWLRTQNLLVSGTHPSASFYQPWLRLNESQVAPFATNVSIMPPTLRATALSGDINLAGDLTLFPSPKGTIELAAAGSLNGLQPTGFTSALIANQSIHAWSSSTINVSDASPASIPGITSPYAYQSVVGTVISAAQSTDDLFLSFIDTTFNETGSTIGAASVLQAKQALHAPDLLHAGDPDPTRLYALGGDISGLTFFSPKFSRILAGHDVTDISFYIQNNAATDISIVSAGRDLVAYNPNSTLRVSAQQPGNLPDFNSPVLAGDIQINGPGTIEVLTGRTLDLGVGPNFADGTGLGLVSIGNARNPYLPFEGADILAAAGVRKIDPTAFVSSLDEADFTSYLQELAGEKSGSLQHYPSTAAEFNQLTAEQRSLVATDVFYRVLRDAGADQPNTGNYDSGFAAIQQLFPSSAINASGDILLTSREIKTRSGGNISLLAPSGAVTVGLDVAGAQPLDQGILTEAGGNISIFAKGDVAVGRSRIFTLRGGNEIIWSSEGDIAAGASAKTVQSAPPTRVLVDAQTADVKTDLAGLATGGGIGVLATVAGVAPGNVALIAPAGTVDAGDAGIRASGNVTIAATTVLNASNISATGSTTGAPSAPSVSAPSLGSIATPSNSTASTAAATADAARQAQQTQTTAAEEPPSIFSVDVVGYGGAGSDDSNDPEEKRRKHPVDPAQQ